MIGLVGGEESDLMMWEMWRCGECENVVNVVNEVADNVMIDNVRNSR